MAITETDYLKNKDTSGVAVTPCRHRRKRSNSLSSIASPEQHQKKLNIGFSVDFESHCRSPMQCVSDIRQQLLEEDDNIQIHSVTPNIDSGKNDPPQEEPSSSRSRRPSGTQDMTYDTFENCLHIANQMEALLSFYYMEEKDPNKITVTEIYPLNDPRSPKPDFDVSDLAWDNYLELKDESSINKGSTLCSDHRSQLTQTNIQGARKRASSLTSLDKLPY